MSKYRQILNNEFKNRIKKNKSYSLRAFARDLNISVSHLSSILNETQGLSVKKASQIAEILQLNKEDELIFTNSVILTHSKSEKHRKIAKDELNQLKKFNGNSKESLIELQADYYEIAFALISIVNPDLSPEEIATVCKLNKNKSQQVTKKFRHLKVKESKNLILKGYLELNNIRVHFSAL